jgi:hypothetical protein
MNSETFIPLALRTDPLSHDVLDRWQNQQAAALSNEMSPCVDPVRLDHVCLGLQTELYEIEFEVVETEDYDNSMLEEIGDLLWYCAIGWDAIPPAAPADVMADTAVTMAKEIEDFWPMDLVARRPQDEEGWLVRLRREIGVFAEVAKPVLFYGRNYTKAGNSSRTLLRRALHEIELCAEGLLKVTTGKTLDEARARVIDKLSTRYPEKFTEQAANERADKTTA